MNMSYGQRTGGAYGAWGQGDVAQQQSVEEQRSYLDIAVEALPLAKAFAEQFTDKFKAVQIAEAKLRNAQMAGVSGIQLSKLQANLNATKRAYTQQLEREQSTRDFRTLGQVATVTGIGIGIAGIFFILTRAVR
jgi:hypothetical protein